MPHCENNSTPRSPSSLARWFRRRRTRLLVCTAPGLLLAGVGWITVTGLLAREELLAAQRALDSLQQQIQAGSPEGLSAAGAASVQQHPGTAVREAAAHAARAHRLTTGPAWYPAAHLPLLGRPLSTVRGTAEAADRLTHDVVPPLVRAGTELSAGAHQDSGHLDLSVLRRAAPSLAQAARTASDVRTEVGRLPRTTWLPPVDQALARLSGRLDRIASAVDNVAAAARVMPSLLGEDRPRRYLAVFENSAEARGTGGLPGAFAVLVADRGRLSFERFGNDNEMGGVRAPAALGAEHAALFAHNGLTSRWVNANLSPHFPYAARIWAAMWRQHSGQRVDGVFALDPHALSGLLAASGPARLPDGTTVTAANVVDLTERTSYASYQDVSERKAFLLHVARAVAERLLDTADEPRRRSGLFTALFGQLREGRVKVWSAHPAEQRELEPRRFGGAVPHGPAPFAGLVVNNAAGTKLDYYLDRRLTWEPGQCTRAGREVTVTVRLTNRAPASELPAYVTQRVDAPPYRTRPGDNRLLLSYYASHGAKSVEATLDGRPALLNVSAERGHPVYTLDVELPAGATRTVVLHLLERPSDRAPVLLRQPLVRPLRATVRPYPPCGE